MEKDHTTNVPNADAFIVLLITGAYQARTLSAPVVYQAGWKELENGVDGCVILLVPLVGVNIGSNKSG
jgi:hypothetical protein